MLMKVAQNWTALRLIYSQNEEAHHHFRVDASGSEAKNTVPISNYPRQKIVTFWTPSLSRVALHLASIWQTYLPMHSQYAKTEHLQTHFTQLSSPSFARPCSVSGSGLSGANKTCSNIPTWHGSQFEEQGRLPIGGRHSLLCLFPLLFLDHFSGDLSDTPSLPHSTGEGRRERISAPPCPHFFSLSMDVWYAEIARLG